MIGLMCKIAAIGLLGAVFGTLLRKQTPELSLLLVLCAGIGMLYFVADGLGMVLEFLKEMAHLAGVEDELLQPVVKTVAISILTKLTMEICRSAGESGLAVFVEICGTVLAVCVSVPLIRAVAVLMEGILG